MKHFAPNEGAGPLCGDPTVGATADTVTDDMVSTDCEQCLWTALADVQNGLAAILKQLYRVTKANRVQVINPVAKGRKTNG